MPLHLLGKKSWNVYNADNVAKVRRDEAEAKAREEAEEQRMQEVDAERRIQLLRGVHVDPPTVSTPVEDVPSVAAELRPERKRRRMAGEDDTERDIRLARNNSSQLRTTNADTVSSARKASSNAPLTDRNGHINLFPEEGSRAHVAKNAEAEAETAKKKREYEDQYTMRLSNAAGFQQGLGVPWYSSAAGSAKEDVAEEVGRNVWGNEDPGRKERERARISSSDPLASMRRGVKDLRKVEAERKKWAEEREREMDELRRKERRSHRPRRTARRPDDDVDDLKLEDLATGSTLARVDNCSNRMALSRNTNTQPTYDFLTGDHGNEDLRAQVKALQYELSTFKQERELVELRHEKELREVQKKGEADFKRAQASESDSHVASHRYDTLARELKAAQDQALGVQADLEQKLRLAQERNQAAQEEKEEAEAEHAAQERQLKHQVHELETRCNTVQRTAKELRDSLSENLADLQAAQHTLSQRDDQVGQLESELLRLKAQTGDVDTLNVIKHELSEQVAHIKKLEAANRDQLTELKRFRKHHRGVEVVEEEKRVLEGKLRGMDDLQRELAEARLQRQILEDEKKSWTTYLLHEGSVNGFDDVTTPEALAKALIQERLEKAALVEKMGNVDPEMAEKEDIIKSLEADKDRLQREAEKLRAGGHGDSKARTRLERQRTLAEKEVQYLRAQLKTFDVEETTFQPENFDEQKTQRIEALEGLVDQYRQELQTLNDELVKREHQPPVDPTGAKRARDDEEPDERLGQLSRKNRKLQSEISKLQQSNSLLQKDLEVASGQVTSLQATSRTRILELRSNPTADAVAIKTSTLEALKTENAALLAQVEGQLTTKVVPISTLENARRDLQEMEKVVADKEKRMARLKQIWSAKSLEFREAVASILGFKMDFMPNGRVRMTSMFYPGGDGDGGADGEANSIVFDGEQGTMKVSGGPDSAFRREIKDLIRFWVEERKEIPCFLAAMTLEFYERTTRAARM
ncbi:MAG: Mitotic spindle assembly checkpoint protein MAD1 [Thelocarpon superellum]|nr:MAG: Mitotic spindle assembly checkpoint protein MAD1 [Thelocarpon superellum]